MGEFTTPGGVKLVKGNQRPVYWECEDKSSAKFWAAKIIIEKTASTQNYKSRTKYILIRKWGKIGTNGQTLRTEFDDVYKAEKELDNLIWGKEAKGYKPIF